MNVQTPKASPQSAGTLDRSPEPCPEARRKANRANAQLSTGPRTPEGKASSCLNAVKTGLTGRTVLLPNKDAAPYQEHLAKYVQELDPVNVRESLLVQSIADTEWRLVRIPALETAIYARGRSQFAEAFSHEDPAARPGLIELETFLAYEKQLRNLQLQEARLRRHRENDWTELRATQKERIAEERAQLADAAALYTAALHVGRPFEPADYGFEFSIDDVEAYLKGVRAAKLYHASLKSVPDRQKSGHPVPGYTNP